MKPTPGYWGLMSLAHRKADVTKGSFPQLCLVAAVGEPTDGLTDVMETNIAFRNETTLRKQLL